MPPDSSHSDPRLVAAFRRFSALAAGLTAGLGALVLAGWAFGVDPLAWLWPGQSPIQPLTAVGLLLAGAALWLLLPEAVGAAGRRLGLLCAGAAAVLGGLVLLEYLSGVSLGLDGVLFAPALAAQHGPHLGRPGPATAANLALVGLALLALHPAMARRLPRWFSAAALTPALVLSSLALLSYFYEAASIGTPAPSLPIEPSSALAGVLLALGVLAARPQGPLAEPLTTTRAGGAVSRRLLPAVILLPFALGWLRLIALRRGLLDIGLGGALYAAGTMVVFTGLVYWAAGLINQAEARREAINLALRASEGRLLAELAERTRTEAALRQSEERFEKAFRASPAGMTVTRRADGVIVEVNDRLVELLGYTRAELIGRTAVELGLYPDPADREALERRVQVEGQVRDVPQTLLTKTGERRSALLSVVPIELAGEAHGLGILIDNTEHRRADEALHQLNAELEARVARRTAELAANEAKLRALFEVLPVGVSILDPQRQMVQSNPALSRILRLPEADLAGGDSTSRQFIRPDGSPMPASEYASVRAFEAQQPVLNVETGILTETGETLWLDVSAAPLPGPGLGVVVVSADLTQRKLAETALRESEEKFSKAFHASGAGIVITRISDERIQEVNDSFLTLTGYTRAEVIGHTTPELGLLQPQARQRLSAQVTKLGRMREYEMEMTTHAGEVKTILTSVELITVGRQPFALSLFYDITERKRTEAELAANEAQLRLLFEAQRRQAQELTLRDMIHTALARELPLPDILRLLVEGIAQTMGYTQVSLYLLAGDTLRLQHQVGYEHVIDSVPISAGVSGRVVRTRQPVLVEDVSTDPDFLAAMDGILSQVCVPLFDLGQVAGVLNLESTQGRRLTAADLRLMLALGGQVDFALDRARLAAQARESQQRFASAFNHATIGMALVSTEGRWLQVNPALCALVGYSEAELLQLSFQTITHPDDLQTDLVNMRQVLAGAIQSYQIEKRYFHKLGHSVWILLGVSLVRDAQGQPLYFISQIQDITERKAAEQALAVQTQVLASERDLMQALMDSIPDTIYFKDLGSRFTRVNRAQAEYLRLASPEAAIGHTDLDLQDPLIAREIFDEEQNLVLRGQPLLNRVDLTVAPDGQPRWISSTKVPLRDSAGQVVGLVGIARDITALKQAEVRLLATLQEKDVLLKEIHHRVKNNLQVVSSLLRLQAETIEDPNLRDAFEDSQRRVRSMALVHEQLYRSADLAHIDFGEYITGLVNYLRRSHARPLHQLRMRVAVENVTLEIDRAIPLGLLVNELVTNSLKYAFPTQSEDAEIWVEAARDAAGSLTVVVGDNGVGLPDSVDLAQPASMGWQLVQSFVTQLHGHFTLRRQPGALFTLTIPERTVPRG